MLKTKCPQTFASLLAYFGWKTGPEIRIENSNCAWRLQGEQHGELHGGGGGPPNWTPYLGIGAKMAESTRALLYVSHITMRHGRIIIMMMRPWPPRSPPAHGRMHVVDHPYWACVTWSTTHARRMHVGDQPHCSATAGRPHACAQQGWSTIAQMGAWRAWRDRPPARTCMKSSVWSDWL